VNASDDSVVEIIIRKTSQRRARCRECGAWDNIIMASQTRKPYSLFRETVCFGNGANIILPLSFAKTSYTDLEFLAAELADKFTMTDLNPQGKQMAAESMVRCLDAQARAIWPQEMQLIRRCALPG
jgi:hypothetical protein